MDGGAQGQEGCYRVDRQLVIGHRLSAGEAQNAASGTENVMQELCWAIMISQPVWRETQRSLSRLQHTTSAQAPDNSQPCSDPTWITSILAALAGPKPLNRARARDRLHMTVVVPPPEVPSSAPCTVPASDLCTLLSLRLGCWSAWVAGAPPDESENSEAPSRADLPFGAQRQGRMRSESGSSIPELIERFERTSFCFKVIALRYRAQSIPVRRANLLANLLGVVVPPQSVVGISAVQGGIASRCAMHGLSKCHEGGGCQ